jgi:glycoprotein endo-alpha-1,2-mannosidase
VLLILALLALALTGAVSAGAAAPPSTTAQDALTQRVLSRVPEAPRLVLALYYPWYGLRAVSGADRHVEHVNTARKQIGNFAHYPASGPYDSTDEATVTRHLRQLKGAGVDAVACSWWGARDFTHLALGKLLPVARREGVKVCAYVERLEKPGDTAAAVKELSELLKTAGQDAAYLKVGGKPVLFVYSRAVEQLGPEAWAEVVVRLERDAAPGALPIAEGRSLVDALVFDGLHVNNPATLPLGAPQGKEPPHRALTRSLVELARRRGRIAVATVSPGFDDRKVARPGGFVDRAGGRVYREFWDAALAAQPDWVLIRSFNQWHDGTEIEPSAEFGDQYLKLTGEFATRFKQAARQADAEKKP